MDLSTFGTVSIKSKYQNLQQNNNLILLVFSVDVFVSFTSIQQAFHRCVSLLTVLTWQLLRPICMNQVT